MKKILSHIIFWLCISGALQAQQLRLTDAVTIALKNSLDIKLADNNLQAATIQNNIGFAGGLPEVTAGISDNEQLSNINQKLNSGNTTKRNNAASNSIGSDITGSILLFNGGRVVATKKRLGELQAKTVQQLNSEVQNVIAAVMLAYYDVVRQQDYVRTIDRSIEASAQELNIVQLRQRVGLANNADLFQSQIDVNVLQQSRLAQQLIVSQAKAELLRLMTLNPDSNIIIDDTILIDRSLELDTVLKHLPGNADIRAAAIEENITALIVKETAAQRYPSIRVSAGYGFSRNQAAAGNVLLNQNYGPTVGLGLTIPIFNGSIYRRQQQVAEINVRNAALQKQVLYRDYTANAVKQYQAYINTRSQLDSAQENYTLSNKLLELTLLRFRLKQATSVEVKIAQQSFEESGFRLVNLNYAAKAAEIELKRLQNTLTPGG